jgi:HEAT repeat protein
VIVPHTFATLLARTVELFSDAAAKDAQKTQFRALIALVKADGVTLHVRGTSLSVNGQTVHGAAFEPLVRRLAVHGVEQVTIGKAPPAGELFELVKALADPPGTQDLAARLSASGADRIQVRVASGLPVPPVPPVPPAAPTPPSGESGAGVPRLDLGVEGVLRADQIGEMPFHTTTDRQVEGPPPAEPVVAEPEDSLARLERDPRARNAAQLLEDIVAEVEHAMRSRRPERATRLLAGITRCERLVPDGDERRPYAIAFRRLYTKPVLKALADLAAAPAYHDAAVAALQRAGAGGVKVLLDLLLAAPTLADRQGILAALGEMKEGTDQLVHMLSDSQGSVVREVVELVGEVGLEAAVPALAEQLGHEDEGVRKAVALALAKIGSGAAAEPLRRALRDKSAAVRMQAALGVGGRKSSALAMPLVVALEEEQDTEVERELILALGRIGSAEAVQALIKFAQPSGRLFGRKPTALRVAAVDALRIAATPAAVGMLSGLAQDADKQVRVAAKEALKDVKA